MARRSAHCPVWQRPRNRASERVAVASPRFRPRTAQGRMPSVAHLPPRCVESPPLARWRAAGGYRLGGACAGSCGRRSLAEWEALSRAAVGRCAHSLDGTARGQSLTPKEDEALERGREVFLNLLECAVWEGALQPHFPSWHLTLLFDRLESPWALEFDRLELEWGNCRDGRTRDCSDPVLPRQIYCAINVP